MPVGDALAQSERTAAMTTLLKEQMYFTVGLTSSTSSTNLTFFPIPKTDQRMEVSSEKLLLTTVTQEVAPLSHLGINFT